MVFLSLEFQIFMQSIVGLMPLYVYCPCKSFRTRMIWGKNCLQTNETFWHIVNQMTKEFRSTDITLEKIFAAHDILIPTNFLSWTSVNLQGLAPMCSMCTYNSSIQHNWTWTTWCMLLTSPFLLTWKITQNSAKVIGARIL